MQREAESTDPEWGLVRRLRRITSRIDVRLFGICAVVAFTLAYSWMSPKVSAPNERSRLLLSLSLIESGTISVDEQVPKYGLPYDIAERDGKFYTDKAPGSSIVALPFVAAYKVLGGEPTIEKITNFARKFAIIPFTLIAVLLIRALLTGWAVRTSVANRTAVAFAVGTPVLHYGASVYGHALVATASLGAAFALQRSTRTNDHKEKRLWQFAMGLIGGVCFALEYQAAVICIALAIAYLSIPKHRNVSSLVAPALGAAIPIGLVLLYNTAAFGGPLETSYAHLYHASNSAKHSTGLFGVTVPTPEAIYGLLASPARGTLFCAPVVTAGLLSFTPLWKRERWLALFLWAGVVPYFVVAAGTDVWAGGWSFGPRLLVPIMGLAVLPAGILLDKWTETSPVKAAALRAYFAAGILYNGFVTFMWPEIPDTFTNPLMSVAVPLAEMGEPSPNIGMFWFGLEGLQSALPGLAVIVGLAGYVLIRKPSFELWSVRKVGAVVVVVLVFGASVGLYPEEKDPTAADKWVTDMAKLRKEAR